MSATEVLPRIRQLDVGIINKIAAGEVIERPGSVVKELVENSLDAGARRVDVHVRGGGLELIRISDDGHGIPPDELRLAVTSHATSKIRTADDLFHIESFGFRGEALASIAEVSHFTIRSRTSTEPGGATLTVDGGTVGDVAPCAAAPGTLIEIQDLFFNTPVRRRFLRTPQTELGNISEALTRLALVHESVHFTLHHNDRPLLDVPPVASWIARIRQLFGGEQDALLPVESDEPGIRIRGFVGHPSHDRGNNRMQYLFLNGRYIRDRALGHAFQEAYRGLLMVGRHPIGFLRLEIPADQFDINVHPTKLEVRFVDSGRIYGHLLGTLRSMFLASDLNSRGNPEGRSAVEGSSSAVGRPAASPFGGTSALPSWSPAPTQARGLELPPLRPTGAAGILPRRDGWGTPPPMDVSSSGGIAPRDMPPVRIPEPLARAVPSQSSEGTPAMQVCQRYLVTESDHGIEVIDQHALHERILYEELKSKVGAQGLEKQRLLIPDPVELTPAEKGAILSSLEHLARLGIEVESFGGNTVLVHTYPAILANISPAELVRAVAERLLTSPRAPEPRDLLDELLHTVSCKAAIKAGDRLTSAEITALLDRRYLIDDAHHCPHGRPTTLVFSREDLDRQFGRI